MRFVPMRKLSGSTIDISSVTIISMVALTHPLSVPFQGPYIEGEKLRG